MVRVRASRAAKENREATDTDPSGGHGGSLEEEVGCVEKEGKMGKIAPCKRLHATSAPITEGKHRYRCKFE